MANEKRKPGVKRVYTDNQTAYCMRFHNDDWALIIASVDLLGISIADFVRNTLKKECKKVLKHE
jgi:hypothetical protein